MGIASLHQADAMSGIVAMVCSCAHAQGADEKVHLQVPRPGPGRGPSIHGTVGQLELRSMEASEWDEGLENLAIRTVVFPAY